MNQTHLPVDNSHQHDITFLAFDRTVFAYERTALAYLRTAMTFLIASVSLIKLFDIFWINSIGYSLIPVMVYFVYLGINKFVELNKMLEKYK